MKKKGLLMTLDNAIKSHNGTKTKTRRLSGLEKVNAKPDDWVLLTKQSDGSFTFLRPLSGITVCRPKFQVGDTMLVREAHYLYGYWRMTGQKTAKGKWKWKFINSKPELGAYFPDQLLPGNPSKVISTDFGWYLRPGLFMHNEHVRTKRVITEVRCERLKYITPEDCIAEGLISHLREYDACVDLKRQYQSLWDTINAKKPWSFNPYVFIYSWAAK